jgi:hypothetical protein
VIGPGTVITGGSVSPTVIVNEPVAVLPREFVALQVTVVVPFGKVSPEEREQVTGIEPSTSSSADTLNVTIEPLGPSDGTAMLLGSESTGAPLGSRTTTANDATDVSPREFVALHCTSVRPIGNVDPDGGVHVTEIVPSTRSVAVTV